MIVVDVETTGTEPHKHSLLSVGAVDLNDPTRLFYEECQIWSGAHIDEEAFVINGFTQSSATDPTKKTDKQIVEEFLAWIGPEDRMLAGHNTGIDRDFLRYTAERYHLNWDLPYRTLDLHSIVYFHMLRRGIKPPVNNNHPNITSAVVSLYVGIPKEPHPHNGLNGAKWEAEAFYRLFYDKPFLEEFKQYSIPWIIKKGQQS